LSSAHRVSVVVVVVIIFHHHHHLRTWCTRPKHDHGPDHPRKS
jgi:hypothetical protein